jgi:hypothetical protein
MEGREKFQVQVPHSKPKEENFKKTHHTYLLLLNRVNKNQEDFFQLI